MTLPTATYRLQLREGMDFDRAATLAPYVARLGCSHLYLSPIFTASTGSTHGYDVTDPSEIDPALGGRAGFERLAAACREAGLGVILDIVPNHTAFTVENPWLRDVLRHGRDSRYAGHFDIFWNLGRLRLPWLEKPFADAVAAGEVRVDDDPDGPVLDAGVRVPLSGDVPEAARRGEADALLALHEAQPWRLAWWRTEAAGITHRRFFAVTGLIGMRVEEPQVFDDLHALTFALVEAGLVQGLRVDHVDGLADPAQYLARLHARLPDTPVWVEKILTGEEYPPADWPIAGTTGYVAARRFAQVLTSEAGARAFRARMRGLTGERQDFRARLMEAKRQIVTQELPSELDQLAQMLLEAAPGTEWGREALRSALISYLCAFPRYRSYATDTLSDHDKSLIAGTVELASLGLPHPGALPLLGEVLLSPEGGRALRTRLQQVTGAAIAKSQEDTAFFRDVALLSANEVGAEPDEPAMDAEAFHAAMARRAELMPHGLTLTSSHDTKRAEDARARIMALSHAPSDGWEALLDLVPIECPPAWRWYLAQSAFAAAPGGNLEARLVAHAEKAMREAKRDTFWTAPDADFEGRVTEAARAAAAAIEPLPEALRPVAERAERLALAQCALKLLAPGIPDIYQGTEVGSFLLTDPDNRRAPDFVLLAEALGNPARLTAFDRAKLSLTQALLALRREVPDAFLRGPYAPMEAGEGRLSFVRGHRGQGVAVTLSVVGEPLEGAGGVWPPEALVAELGPQPVVVERL